MVYASGTVLVVHMVIQIVGYVVGSPEVSQGSVDRDLAHVLDLVVCSVDVTVVIAVMVDRSQKRNIPQSAANQIDPFAPILHRSLHSKLSSKIHLVFLRFVSAYHWHHPLSVPVDR